MNPADVAASAHVFVSALSNDCIIDGTDGHHLARVLRLRPDEIVTAADGNGGWRTYTVRSVEGSQVVCSGVDALHIDPAPEVRLAIAFALTKSDKPETTVMHLTELGVDRIIPVAMAHSVVRWDGAKAAAAHARFVTKAREAAMQSRRTRIPIVEPVRPLADVLAHPALVVADAGGTPIGEVTALDAAPSGSEWCGIVGPEGGFRADERDALRAASPVPVVALGANVLRAETAALALAALLGARRH